MRRAQRSASSILIRWANRSPSSSCAVMTLLVAKVTLTGEHHHDSRGVRRVNDLLVANRTTRLHDGRDAGARQRLQTVGEWEERVRRRGGTLCEFTGLGRCDIRHYHPRLLTGADSYRDPVTRDHDRVRRRACAYAPRDGQILELLFRRLRDGDNLPFAHRYQEFVRVLHQRRVTEGSHRESERFGRRGAEKSRRLSALDQDVDRVRIDG